MSSSSLKKWIETGIFFISFFLLFSCSTTLKNENNTNQSSSLYQVDIYNSEKKKASFFIEKAETQEERTLGLMHRTELSKNQGMLFIFEAPLLASFWMKNTLIPLDMIFINEEKKIVFIQKNAEPCKADPCPLYSSPFMASSVLEINANLADQYDIQIGDTVKWN